MMIFTVCLDADKLRLEWTQCAKWIHEEIVARIRTIPGYAWDRDEKCWRVPLAAFDQVLEVFPKASVEYDAWKAADARLAASARHLITLLLRNGARLAIDEQGNVIATGPCVSPLVAKLVREHSDLIRDESAAQYSIRADNEPRREPLHGGIGGIRRFTNRPSVRGGGRRRSAG